jgi:hypothetical protein
MRASGTPRRSRRWTPTLTCGRTLTTGHVRLSIPCFAEYAVEFLRTICGLRGPLTAFPQVRGSGRRGWSVGRVLFPGALRRTVRRPSISGRRCRRPHAVHPRTRAGSPRACAVRPCSGRGLPSRSGHPDRWWSLAPPFHPYLTPADHAEARPAVAFRRSVLCGTVPRVAPGGCCPPPCPSEPGPSSTSSVSPECAAAARPTPPRSPS